MSGCQTDAVTGIHVAMTQHVPSSSWMTLGPWGCETPADQVYIDMRVLPLATALAPRGEVSRLRPFAVELPDCLCRGGPEGLYSGMQAQGVLSTSGYPKFRQGSQYQRLPKAQSTLLFQHISRWLS